MVELEDQRSTCYTSLMPRKAKAGEKRTEMLTAKVPPSIKTAVMKIVEADDRTESYVTLALVVRGLAAYNKDRKLVEPEEQGGNNNDNGVGSAESHITARVEPAHRQPQRKRGTK